MNRRNIVPFIGFLLLAVMLCPSAGSAYYLKMTSPPDVDKSYPNNTCWLATAANMLAGAGYGVSSPITTPQGRAMYIYGQLVEEFGQIE